MSEATPSTLDRLTDDRLATAIDLLRFLRGALNGDTRSWWAANGTDEARALVDLANIGLIHGREMAGGIRAILRRQKRGLA
jgi:hypothetical protein